MLGVDPNWRYQAPKPVPVAAPSSGRGAPVAGVDGNWQCPSCQNINYGIRTACNRCGLPKPQPAPLPASGRGMPVEGVDGNWRCPSCQNVNYGMRTACNRCAAPKPEPVAIAPQGFGNRGRGAPVAGVDGNWACTACGNVNYAVREACNVCQRPKHEVALPVRTPGRAPAPGVDGNWSCPACGNVNYAVRQACNRCQAPKPELRPQLPQRGKAPVAGVDGNWACPSCGNVNWAIREACNRCQAPKPQEQFLGHQLAIAPPQPSPRRPSGAPVAGVDGNWSCPACRNVNYAMREACNRCGEPKPPEEDLLLEKLAAAPQPAARRPSGAPVAGVDGNWECRSCGNVNYAMREACNRCGVPKPPEEEEEDDEPPLVEEEEDEDALEALDPVFEPSPQAPRGRIPGGPPVAGVDGNWSCSQCGNINFAHRVACNRCQAPKPPIGGRAPRLASMAPVAGIDGNWECPLCRNVNFGHREACNRCQLPRPLDDAEVGEELDPDAGLIEQLMEPAEDEEPAAKRQRM